MPGEAPLLETLAEMTAASVERAGLDDRSLMLVRLAGLAAVDAPGSSYLVNLGVAAESGLSLEDVQGVLVALAPIVGGPRTLSAAQTITDTLGFALAVAIAQAQE